MQIDVIIPTYNRAGPIERAISSVLKQSYKNYLLTLVDDGSTDETSSILQKYANHPQVKILTQENRGVSAARNLGILSSSNPWVSFLDSDDEWLPHKLEEQVRFHRSHPDLRFIHSNEIWIRHDKRVNPKQKFNKENTDLFKRSLECCLISPSTSLMKRELLLEHGMFNEEFLICEDYDLWNKILAREEVGFVPEELIKKYGGHKDQLSTSFIAMDYWRIKSLIQLFQATDLSLSQKKLVQDEIQKKKTILFNGFEKHGQIQRMDEITELLRSVF